MKAVLQKIVEKAKLKPEYTPEIIQFSQVILTDWVKKCAEAANEEETEYRLVSFRLDYKFEGVKVKYLIKSGLLEYLQKQTELDVKYKEYIINKESRVIQEIDPNQIEIMDDGVFYQCGAIYLVWE